MKELSDRGSTVLAFDWDSFGPSTEVSSHLGRFSFEYSQPQWDRVRSLLDQVDRLDLDAHMWPEHLSEQATLLDERGTGIQHDVSSAMQSEKEYLRNETKNSQKTAAEKSKADASLLVVRSGGSGSVRVGLASV